MGVHRYPDGREVYYMGLHREILVVYVPGYANDWKAYIFPVPGMNHEQEATLWQSKGQALSQDQARALWPGIAEEFDRLGLRWRD